MSRVPFEACFLVSLFCSSLTHGEVSVRISGLIGFQKNCHSNSFESLPTCSPSNLHTFHHWEAGSDACHPINCGFRQVKQKFYPGTWRWDLVSNGRQSIKACRCDSGDSISGTNMEEGENLPLFVLLPSLHTHTHNHSPTHKEVLWVFCLLS